MKKILSKLIAASLLTLCVCSCSSNSGIKIIQTDDAPAAIGPYSQGYIADGFLYTSGQIAIDPKTNVFKDGTIEEQTTLVISNLIAIIKAANTSIDKVIKTTCYLTDINDFSKFNSVYEQYFVSKPARSCVEVSALPKGAKVEIELVAYVG